MPYPQRKRRLVFNNFKIVGDFGRLVQHMRYRTILIRRQVYCTLNLLGIQARALDDVQRFEGALKQCVKVPLHQYEYDAYISLSYNIGSKAFCGSTLVKKLNAGDFDGACQQVLRWDRFKGKPLAGLTKRRQAEYEQCKGIK